MLEKSEIVRVESDSIVSLKPIFDDIKQLKLLLNNATPLTNKSVSSDNKKMSVFKKKIDDLSKYVLLLEKRVSTLESSIDKKILDRIDEEMKKNINGSIKFDEYDLKV